MEYPKTLGTASIHLLNPTPLLYVIFVNTEEVKGYYFFQ